MRCALLFLLLAGCGWGPTLMQACTDLATVECDKRSQCSDGFNLTLTYGDRATCIQRSALTCTISNSAPEVAMSPLAIEDCVFAYPSYSCFDFFATNPPPACALPGARPIGAACSVNAQCQSHFCDGIKTALCGTCTPPPVAGAPCVSSSCAPLQQCSAGVCVPVTNLGQACDDTKPCGSDLNCVDGTCMQALDVVDAPCGTDALGYCDSRRGLVCVQVTSAGVCRPITIAGNGQACGKLTDGTSASCGGDGQCYVASGTPSTCKAAAADGQPCDAVLGPPCLPPARCVVGATGSSGVCTLPSSSACM